MGTVMVAEGTASACTHPKSLLAERYRSVRGETERLCKGLSAEDQMVQSCAEASPVKWHQAHTSWFFETFVLREFLAGYQPFHEDFHWLFNSYYKSLGEEIPEKSLRASFSRPSLDQIIAFRAHVDAAIARLLENDAPEEALRRIVLGLNHEQQHQELALTDIEHAFFINPLHPVYAESAERGLHTKPAGKLAWTSFAGGLAEIGYPLQNDDPMDFCFDNETPRHTVYLQPYRLANRLTTVREYLEFMEDGGYRRPELWLSEGWETMEREGWNSPLYWKRSAQDEWRVFTLAGWQSLESVMETPVCHVSLFEADAFARWSRRRLPTEAEWEIAAQSLPVHGNLLESRTFAPRVATGEGLQQIFGDCWEWMASPYTGYPGYQPLPGALGEYNGKFMSSQVLLRGGSCVTPESHVRATYRNFFTPATRWQFSGIRLADAV